VNVCVRCSYELGIEKPRYVASLFIDRQRVRTRTVVRGGGGGAPPPPGAAPPPPPPPRTVLVLTLWRSVNKLATYLLYLARTNNERTRSQALHSPF